jgi:chlorobactene glucosyltransferase
MILEYFLILIAAILLVLLILCIVNVSTIQTLEASDLFENVGKVSVLIPARNEEHNIGNCLNSVFNQTYRDMEIIVLNDGSTDKTSEILESYSDERLKVINGIPLEKGWVGKNFACHQLQKSATGKYLLFIDADTELNESCVASSVMFAEEHSTDLLSVMPNEKSETFWEKLVIPMLYFAVTVFLPFPMIERSSKKQYAMGNGQFMLFRREFYDKIGGHESLKSKIVEDVWLARRVKEFKGKLIFADASSLVSCRMYRNLNEVWQGFSKNLFAGLSFSTAGLVFTVLTYLILFVLPPLLLLTGFLKFNAINIVILIIPILMRLIQAFRFKQPVLFSFLNPLSALFIVAVALNSFRLIRFGKGATWKGREYSESVISKN